MSDKKKIKTKSSGAAKKKAGVKKPAAAAAPKPKTAGQKPAVKKPEPKTLKETKEAKKPLKGKAAPAVKTTAGVKAVPAKAEKPAAKKDADTAKDKLPPEAMQILSKRPKHTPAVFKLPTRKHTPIVFTLEEVREVIKSKKSEPGPGSAKIADSKKSDMKPGDSVKKKSAAGTGPKRRVVGAASLTEILGFNPKSSAKPKSPETREVPAKFSKYYKKLTDLRDRVSSILSEHAQDTLKKSSKEDSGDLSSYGQHIADAGTDTSDRDFALNLISSEQDALFEIDAAIERIFKGTYGVCEITGKPITKERLDAVPHTRYSREGQDEVERGKRRRTDRSGTFLDSAAAEAVLAYNEEEPEE